jgi:hypothetical protein
MLVVKSGLPQYQEIVSAVLAGGATSLTDSLPPSPLGAAARRIPVLVAPVSMRRSCRLRVIVV